MAYEYNNGLGVGKTYGPYEPSQFGTCPVSFGVVQQLLVPYGAVSIPEVQDLSDRYITPAAAARDPEGDSNVKTIPANSFIVSAYFYTSEDFEDATVVSVGANDADDNGDDAGFVADVGSTTAGTWTVGAGALVGASVGDNDLQFSSGADNVDTGQGILIIEYIEVPVV